MSKAKIVIERMEPDLDVYRFKVYQVIPKIFLYQNF